MSTNTMSVREIHEWAAKCESAANDPGISGEERDRLLKMKRALLDLAREQEWLDGKRSGNPSR